MCIRLGRLYGSDDRFIEDVFKTGLRQSGTFHVFHRPQLLSTFGRLSRRDWPSSVIMQKKVKTKIVLMGMRGDDRKNTECSLQTFVEPS